MLAGVVAHDYESRWRTTQTMAAAARGSLPSWVVDLVATYDHLFLAFDPLLGSHDDATAFLDELYEGVRGSGSGGPGGGSGGGSGGGRVLRVPVLFGGEAGPDLDDVARELGLEPETLVERLTASPWRVRFVAGPVGTPFTDRPDWDAEVPRMRTPRVGVPPGSLGLSGSQSIIYPVRSPGGWRLVGRTPLRLLAADLDSGDLVPYGPDDLLQYAAIGPDDYEALLASGERLASSEVRAGSSAGSGPVSGTGSSAGSSAGSGGRTGAAMTGAGGTDRVSGAILVESVGLAAVQDLGRPGHGHQGISANGASDRWSAQLANTLVGNDPGAPLIEVVGSALALRVQVDVLVCVTGAETVPTVDGALAPAYDPFVVPAGARLVVPSPTRGLRTYVAVAGGLDGATVLGSVAPDRMLGVGQHLAARDRLAVADWLRGWQHPHFAPALFHLGAPRPTWNGPTIVDVTAGPELGEYDAAPLRGPWTVSEQSDAVGLRTGGATPTRAGSAEILSRGVPVGAVEVPPGGGLLLLLHGRLITAGYPVPYVATTAGIDRLGQARPGDELLLREVPLPDAVAQARTRHQTLLALARRTGTALSASGLDHLLDEGHLSREARPRSQ